MKIIDRNLRTEIKQYKPDVLIIGFTVTNIAPNTLKLDLDNIDVPLYIILNKEYQCLEEKLDWIKNIKPSPKKIFTVHHDIKKYSDYCKLPFYRIMWSADHSIFKSYSIDYNYDLFFSGVIREEQTNNLRNKIYNNLDKLKDYKILIKAGFIVKGKLKGEPYTFSNVEYAKKISESKIILTTTGPGDLVGTRYFEIMATNKALIMCNKMPEEVYNNIFIDKYNCIMFDNENDFVEKFKYYIEHEDERLKIVNTAYQNFIEKHTWNHKVQDLLDNL